MHDYLGYYVSCIMSWLMVSPLERCLPHYSKVILGCLFLFTMSRIAVLLKLYHQHKILFIFEDFSEVWLSVENYFVIFWFHLTKK